MWSGCVPERAAPPTPFASPRCRRGYRAPATASTELAPGPPDKRITCNFWRCAKAIAPSSEAWRFGVRQMTRRCQPVSVGAGSLRRNIVPRCHGVPSFGRTKRSSPYQPATRQAMISNSEMMMYSGFTPADPAKM